VTKHGKAGDDHGAREPVAIDDGERVVEAAEVPADENEVDQGKPRDKATEEQKDGQEADYGNADEAKDKAPEEEQKDENEAHGNVDEAEKNKTHVETIEAKEPKDGDGGTEHEIVDQAEEDKQKDDVPPG
jgi:hypothetical protein